ncbi:MAG: nicotinamide riboside transporter PnuC [Telluria sp.]
MDQTLMVFGLQTTPLELAAFVLSVLTVVLTIRQNHWAWLFTILSSALYGGVFFDARLYGDMALQLVFIAAALWGWYQWLRGGPAEGSLPVTRLSRAGLLAGAIGWAMGFLLLSMFLFHFTNTDVPHADGFLTAGSLLGQLLLARKKIENWHTWIVVDVLYVALYVYKQLMLTAILYAVFVLLAVQGLRVWRKALA